MKNTTISILSLAMITQNALAGIPSFEKNTDQKVAQLLGHAPQVMNVYEAQKKGLDRAASKFQPWSGSYWPDINGNIAAHYRDHTKANAQVTMLFNYPTGRRTFSKDFNTVVANFDSWDKETLGQKLAPSEKYDLLMGDTDFTLTKSIMEELDFRAYHRLMSVNEFGEQVDESSLYSGDGTAFSSELQEQVGTAHPKTFKWNTNGKSFALWSGICDGWGPASIYLPRPVKPITVTGAKGHVITFYPEDLKALGTYLFARTNTPYLATMNYQYAGKRCDEKIRPDRARGTGYVEDMRCNDLDAGVWHAILLNRIGKDRLGFMMDIDNNVKVNNHPIHGYSLTYFHPTTGKEGSLRGSMQKIDEVRFDGYSPRRNPKAVYLVGVKSKIDYLNYIWAEQRHNISTDNPGEDKKKDVEYTYDLELDEKGNIVGGEWGNRAHDRRILGKVKYARQPDFIWLAAPNNLPYSTMASYVIPGEKKDYSVARPFGNMTWAYDGKTMPADWIAAAKKDAQWAPPIVDDGTNTEEAVGSVLKSGQPLSHVIYYLFDQARSKAQD